VVFEDLWRRPDLTPRDRSLVTIAALAAMGDDDQLDHYLRRGLESGLTREQITEALTHLGFYAGWSKAAKAMTAVTRSLGNGSPRRTASFDSADSMPSASPRPGRLRSGFGAVRVLTEATSERVVSGRAGGGTMEQP
jgi:4-carboxymuconolactone decarboxylase